MTIEHLDIFPQGIEFSIFDHFGRAKFFLEQAINLQNNGDWKVFSWCINTSIYSCRAIKEVIECHAKDFPKSQWHDFDKEYSTVRHATLIATYRVQDFHRSAISFLPGFTAQHGVVKVKTSKQTGSEAEASVDSSGQVHETKKRNASIKFDRPIFTSGGNITTEENISIPIQQMVNEYLEDLYKLVSVKSPNVPWETLRV
ncbi:hypothetical protein [Candidatus Colwellia aromaticivorans]|uniref:hypothetical protein n=1 Tax=Candidatus Colwellia aromaticivorans TaxID=2267621 RepID=UPI000DF45486|nr:hypothetical protein [Candidatus Colwellia aromaticivorans]